MAFASGSASFQRFFIAGSFHSDVTDEFIAALNERSFGRVGELPDGSQIGWIGPRHLFETTLEAEHIAYGRFAHLALRVDKAKVPGNVLKSYIRMEEEVMLQASGRDFLSKFERRQARETAMQRADQELRSGAHRKMSSYPVLIDLEGGAVYLANTGTSLADKVMALFRQTFSTPLEPADQGQIAFRIMQAANQARLLENLQPSYLVNPPDDMGEPADFSRGELNFLGPEFLTWLWRQTDVDHEPLTVRSGGEVSVMIDKTLKLKCDFDLTGTDTIAADNPASLPEAKAALKIGKRPVRAGLVIGGPSGEFRLVLDATRMTVGSMTPPEVDAELDARTMVETRFEQIADGVALLDALFEQFLLKRTSREWSHEKRLLSAWAQDDKSERQLHAASA